MRLHCSDAAYEILREYVTDAQSAMYACYFLASALEHAAASVFPTECDVLHWVAKAMHRDAGLEELKPIREQIRASGFLRRLVEGNKPLVQMRPGRVSEYRLTALGEELAQRLLPLMEC